MTVKYSKFKSLCKNCMKAGDGYLYIRIGNIPVTLCKSCAELMARQIRSMSNDSKKQVEQ